MLQSLTHQCLKLIALMARLHQVRCQRSAEKLNTEEKLENELPNISMLRSNLPSGLKIAVSGAGSNFEQGSDKEKRADFSKLGLTGYSGDKVISQRDIQRLVRILHITFSSACATFAYIRMRNQDACQTDTGVACSSTAK